MKQIVKRFKGKLPEGTSDKISAKLNWIFLGKEEAVLVRMKNIHKHYLVEKPCGAITHHVHPCDVRYSQNSIKGCGHCELSGR